jgi:hypothetical protein
LEKWKVKDKRQEAGRVCHSRQRYNLIMIHLLRAKATSEQLAQMSNEYESMIKIVVDIRRRILAGGGEMHSDCESVLLDDGSEQDDLWGANWYPADQEIVFESLINIRPRLGNRGILIQSEDLRQQVESITREILGGVN